MKKIFATISFCLLVLFVSAQDLTLEQTVKYINEKTEGLSIMHYKNGFSGLWSPDFVGKFTVESNGLIVLTTKYQQTSRFNLFDLPNLEDKIKAENIGGPRVRIDAGGLGLIIQVPTSIESERLVKAFKHLSKVCVKTKDPFDN